MDRTQATHARTFGWLSIVRLGLVQAALGSVVVLTTSTFNRVMVVELALAAMLPGALVTLHHAMQLLRPRMGYGSDVGQRHTPWIVWGIVALAVGAIGAASSIAVMQSSMTFGLALAMLSYALIGGGVSASGTSLLVLLAKRVDAPRRAAASTVVWMMMIAGFAITAGVCGALLDPYSPSRLIAVASGVGVIAVVVTLVAIRGVEGRRVGPPPKADAWEVATDHDAFRAAFRDVWRERGARNFTIFVFVSMLAYSAQDLILEPFAGAVFGWTPGESTQLAGTQHGGVFLGMLLVAVVTTIFKGSRLASLQSWVIGGCLASAAAMGGLVLAGTIGAGNWPLTANVFVLGVANGAFSIAAIASMMTLAGNGRRRREGTRMGLWGAAQSIAFGLGGFLGTALVDAAGLFTADGSGVPYAFVFAAEAAAFVAAAKLVRRAGLAAVDRHAPKPASRASTADPSIMAEPA